ncbi:MAG: beta-phosphoglucomutase family hydrolase [Planctomycetota bacterium]
MQPQALIFDLDGTLADTMPVHYLAWQQALADTGLAFPEDKFYSCGGMATVKIVELLCKEQGVEADPIAISKAKYEAFFPFIDQVQRIDPVVSIAEEHHGKLPMAVATGGRTEPASRTIAHTNIGHLFNAVVTADDVEHHKPHPETYLKAAEALGVDPTKCVAYEDADPGVVSAREAGMQVVDVRELLAKL